MWLGWQSGLFDTRDPQFESSHIYSFWKDKNDVKEASRGDS